MRMFYSQGIVLMPRSSSPDPVYVDKMQCVVEQGKQTQKSCVSQTANILF